MGIWNMGGIFRKFRHLCYPQRSLNAAGPFIVDGFSERRPFLAIFKSTEFLASFWIFQ
jgi:hypothetical protein